ncbi:MAG: 4Fe-4S dicluster domain-containing protein [bacterium]
MRATEATTKSDEILQDSFDNDFTRKVKALGIPNLSRCYQCLKCANGCPFAAFMDYTPSQIMRMATLGMKDEILKSSTIWLCAACHTCTTRCPMEIDVASVMDALKEIALKEGAAPAEAEKKIRYFHQIFNNIIRARGRLHEPLLLGHYKLRTRNFAQDIALGRKMLSKRRLRLYLPKIRNNAAVRKIFDKIKKKT